MTASFAPFNMAFLSWVALVPLFVALDGASLKEGLYLGFIAGSVHFITLLYWIIVALGHYGGLNIFASIGILLLFVSYLALFPAIFSCLFLFLKDCLFYGIAVSACWVSLEYARAHLMTGFPWCLFGYTQYKNLYFLQSADLFGVYGLSFLVVLVNVSLWSVIFKRRNKGVWIETIITVVVVFATLGYGYHCLSRPFSSQKHVKDIKVLIVQGNIDQSVKWNPDFRRKTITTYMDLTEKGIISGADLVVWPETSLPCFFQDNKSIQMLLAGIIKRRGILVFGSPAYSMKGGVLRYYNRAYMLSPYRGGDIHVQYYDKVHLVPFGEYVPLKTVLGFINRIVPAAGDFEAGNKIKLLTADGLKIGVLICFEAIFPSLARFHSQIGANILINLTNDAWFGKTGAPYQHLSMAVFRAVENRLPMVRAANTGISAIIRQDGRIVAKTDLFRRTTILHSIGIYRHEPTFYVRYGYLFPLLLMFLFVVIIIHRLKVQKMVSAQ